MIGLGVAEAIGGAQTESRFIKCKIPQAMRWKVYGHTEKHRWVLSFDTKPFLNKSKLSHHDTTKCALCQGKWSASMFTGCVWASKRTDYTVEQLQHYKKTQQAIITTAPSLCQAFIPLPSLPVMIPMCPAAHVVHLKWQTHVGEIRWCHRDTEWRDLGATRHSQAFKFFPSLFPFIWFLEQRQRLWAKQLPLNVTAQVLTIKQCLVENTRQINRYLYSTASWVFLPISQCYFRQEKWGDDKTWQKHRSNFFKYWHYYQYHHNTGVFLFNATFIQIDT